MTAPARAPSSEAAGLLGTLMVTVRNEFRNVVLEFDADDPVFGTGGCRVAGCERHCRGQGLCQGIVKLFENACGAVDVSGRCGER